MGSEPPFTSNRMITLAEWPPSLDIDRADMDQIVIENAQSYASRHQLHLAERLGFGIHGIIYVAEHNSGIGRTAVKVHRETEPFEREHRAYQRLKRAEVTRILGFNVPQLVRVDEKLRVIEMSIVARPFVLDFAGAHLDDPPSFPDEIWADWEEDKREKFEDRWPTVQEVLARLRTWGIHMVDVSPTNIAFAD